jgi:hypothetical protein
VRFGFVIYEQPLLTCVLECRGYLLHKLSNHAKQKISIPFFFEPNFNARVAPLGAALRIQEDLSLTSDKWQVERMRKKTYEPTIYGDFLLKKVGSNFAIGQGKYD